MGARGRSRRPGRSIVEAAERPSSPGASGNRDKSYCSADVWYSMTLAEPREDEYECVQCGRRETAVDALLSTCRRCGGEMRNVELIQE
ncbi:rubrerythrin-like domain-containing protein [Halosolutus amylolyticus]|uniref:Rubrerythrin-like domain-containing protein n=1 Tax=Halosolutus amylolyticus TaxID=2932267 RepID=A0ABD5PVS9_9EURY